MAHWPAIYNQRKGLFWREVSPMAVLLLPNREIRLVTEEKAWIRRHPDKLENKAPSLRTALLRACNMRACTHEQLDTPDLTIGTAQGMEKVKMEFPADRAEEIRDFVRQTEQAWGHG